MKLHAKLWTMLMSFAFVMSVPPALAQSPDEKAAMEAMAQAAAPGAEHKGLEILAGSWDTVTKAWMAPGDPMVSKGHSTYTAMYGGRYVRQDFTGDFLGQRFEGTGLTGYDKVLKTYVATWADSMSTGIMHMTGTYDAAKKTYAFEGPYGDPMSGQTKISRMSLRVVGPDEHVMEWFDMLPDGKWVRIMEITYTRTK